MVECPVYVREKILETVSILLRSDYDTPSHPSAIIRGQQQPCMCVCARTGKRARRARSSVSSTVSSLPSYSTAPPLHYAEVTRSDTPRMRRHKLKEAAKISKLMI